MSRGLNSKKKTQLRMGEEKGLEKRLRGWGTGNTEWHHGDRTNLDRIQGDFNKQRTKGEVWKCIKKGKTEIEPASTMGGKKHNKTSKTSE